MPTDDPVDPLERLLNLVGLLLDQRQPLAFEQIADRMDGYGGSNRDSAKRKFERDKDTLRGYGVPVEFVDMDVWGTEQGYTISKEAYYLPEIAFTPEEITALFLAAQSGTEADGASAAVRKLLYGAEGGLLTGLGGSPLIAASDTSGDRISAAVAAADGRRRVRFAYRNAQGAVADREVDAYGVVFRGGHWYLVGSDQGRQEIRAFRLSRCMSEPVDVSAGSEPPEGFAAAAHVQGGSWAGEPREMATVAFAPGAGVLALLSFPGAVAGGPRSDGWNEVSIPMADEDATAAALLQYGPEAEVLAPPALRAAVRDRLLEIVGA